MGNEPKRPIALTAHLGPFTPEIKTWSYMALLPSDNSTSGYEVQNLGYSKGVIWESDFLFWTGTTIYPHTQDMNWVMYNGTLYNTTGLNYVSPKDLVGRQTWDEYWEAIQSVQEGAQRISDKGGAMVAAVKLIDGVKSIYSVFKARNLAKLSEESVINKLNDYVLNKEHPSGGTKANWFEKALGFTRENLKDLAKQVKFDQTKAVQTGITEYGTKYNQVISITGANGKTIDVTFAWIKNKDDVVRLVTALPAKK